MSDMPGEAGSISRGHFPHRLAPAICFSPPDQVLYVSDAFPGRVLAER